MPELQRTLSFPMLLIITVNSIMGTGIFFLPAVAAREAGPASVLAWAIMAVIAMITGLIFAELVGMFPKAGGIYEYTKQAFGTFPSFMFGWMTLVAANVTIAMLVVGAIRYLNPALPEFMKIGLSILLVVIFNSMAYRGMQTSAVMLIAFGMVTVVTLFTLTIPGMFTFDTGRFVPLFTHPFSHVLLAVFLVAETFFGWETATFLAEETKDPEKTMPKALWLGTAIIIALSLLFVTISLGNVNWQAFGEAAAPLSYLAGGYFGAQSVPIISILVYLAIIGSVAGWIVAAPRLIMSLAEDKLFIQQFAEIHPKYKTPHKAIAFQTVVTSLLIVIGSGNFETLLELLVPLVLVMYAGVVISFIMLRKRKPQHKRPFKVWLGVPLAVLATAAMISLIGVWVLHAPGAFQVLRLAASFIFAGVPVFLLLTYFYNPDVLISTMNRLAFLSLWFENITFPKSVRKRIIGLFLDVNAKHAVELGAGVGTLTQHLAEAVGTKGKVTALDFSKSNVEILEKRMHAKGHHHVSVLHDPHLVNRVHPSVERADLVVSVGNLSYVQDIKKVLQDLYDIMPERAQLCFVEYVDMFWFLPNNPKWVKDTEYIRDLFNDVGFSVSVRVERGILWNYVYIYGVKEQRDVPYV